MVLSRQQVVYGAIALVAVVLAIWLLVRSPVPGGRPAGGKGSAGSGEFPDRPPGVKK